MLSIGEVDVRNHLCQHTLKRKLLQISFLQLFLFLASGLSGSFRRPFSALAPLFLRLLANLFSGCLNISLYAVNFSLRLGHFLYRLGLFVSPCDELFDRVNISCDCVYGHTSGSCKGILLFDLDFSGLVEFMRTQETQYGIFVVSQYDITSRI